MKNWIPLFLVVAIMSCSSPKALEYKNYHNFKIGNLGFNTSTISFDLEYYNPNNFGLQLKNTDLDIYINGILLGHSRMDTLIRIPRRDTFSVPVTFNVEMQQIYKNAMQTLLGKEILIRLNGSVRVGKANIFKSFPVEYETKQAFSFF